MADKNPRRTRGNAGARKSSSAREEKGIRIRRTADGRMTADGLPNRSGRSRISLSGKVRKAKGRRNGRRIFTAAGIIALAVICVIAAGILAMWNYVFSGFKPDDGKTTTPYPTEALTYSPPFDEAITNILLIGADATESEEGNGLSDSLIILTVDSKNNAIRMTSIMRDCYVYIPGQSAPNKINAAHMIGGPELALRTINNTLRLNIEYYISVNMARMKNIIDIAGGVTLDVTGEEVAYLNKIMSSANQLPGPGVQVLNGTQAVQYARIRKIDSDTVRTRRQRDVLIALFRMFKEASVVGKTRMIQQGLAQIRSNMTASQITSLGMAVVPKMSSDVEQLKLPIDGYYKTNTHGGWYMVVDYNATIPLLYKFIYGQTHPFDPVPTIPFPSIPSGTSYASDSVSSDSSADSWISDGSADSALSASGISSENPDSSSTSSDPWATPADLPESGASSAPETSTWPASSQASSQASSSQSAVSG